MAMLDKWSLGQLDKGYLMINDCNIDNGLHMHTCIYVYSIWETEYFIIAENHAYTLEQEVRVSVLKLNLFVKVVVAL